MEISEIQIVPIKPNNGLVAFASVVFNDDLYLGSIAIYTKANGDGYRLTYPTKIISNKNINIYHPINKVASQTIEEAIINKYKKVMKENYENTSEN